MSKVSNELYRSGKIEKTKIPDIKVVTASKLSVKVRQIFGTPGILIYLNKVEPEIKWHFYIFLLNYQEI